MPAAKEISANATVAALLSELDVSTLKESQISALKAFTPVWFWQEFC